MSIARERLIFEAMMALEDMDGEGVFDTDEATWQEIATRVIDALPLKPFGFVTPWYAENYPDQPRFRPIVNRNDPTGHRSPLLVLHPRRKSG